MDDARPLCHPRGGAQRLARRGPRKGERLCRSHMDPVRLSSLSLANGMTVFCVGGTSYE